ncbi:MAG: metalloregulator ArsR/SmtB family transcription factor [Armatimonadota bacterium]
MPNNLRQFKADIFQALAHPTRIAIIEMLQGGEVPAGVIIERLRLEQANASQHLAVLRSKLLVTSRKEGNQVLYSIRDPLLTEILALLRRYCQSQLQETALLLEEIDGEVSAR